MGRFKSDDGEVLLQALKTLKEPVQKQDIPEIVTEIKWGKNPIKKVERLLNAAGDRISRPIRGFYQYAEIVEEKVQEPVQLPKAVEFKQEYMQAPAIPSAVKYRVGDFFTGIVTGTEDYGVFVETDNGVSGLLHRTRIRNGISPHGLAEISKLFRIGDVVTTKIAAINPEGKISLTTQGMDLPRGSSDTNPIWDKLQEVKIVGAASLSPAVFQPKVIPDTPKIEEKKPMHDNELEQLISYLKEKVGTVSPAARVTLSDVINKHGMFKTMMALTKTVETFKVDLSLAFVNELAKQVSP